MNWPALAFVIYAWQDQPAAPAQQPAFEIVENNPGKGAAAASRNSASVRTRRASGGKPIRIKSATRKGIPKFKKPKRRG